MKHFEDMLIEEMKNHQFAQEYDALDAEFSIIQAIIDARNSAGLTQKELSERSGIARADISRMENGNANPSLRTLRKLAAGLGMNLKIEFVQNEEAEKQYGCHKVETHFQVADKTEKYGAKA